MARQQRHANEMNWKLFPRWLVNKFSFFATSALAVSCHLRGYCCHRPFRRKNYANLHSCIWVFQLSCFGRPADRLAEVPNRKTPHRLRPPSYQAWFPPLSANFLWAWAHLPRGDGIKLNIKPTFQNTKYWDHIETGETSVRLGLAGELSWRKREI